MARDLGSFKQWKIGSHWEIDFVLWSKSKDGVLFLWHDPEPWGPATILRRYRVMFSWIEDIDWLTVFDFDAFLEWVWWEASANLSCLSQANPLHKWTLATSTHHGIGKIPTRWTNQWFEDPYLSKSTSDLKQNGTLEIFYIFSNSSCACVVGSLVFLQRCGPQTIKKSDSLKMLQTNM